MDIKDLKNKLNDNKELLTKLKNGMSAKVNELSDKYLKDGEQLLQISNNLIKANEVIIGIIDPYIQLCTLLPELTLAHEQIKKACNNDLSELLNTCEQQVSQFSEVFKSEKSGIKKKVPEDNNDPLSGVLDELKKDKKKELPSAKEVIDYINLLLKDNASIGQSKIYNHFSKGFDENEYDTIKKRVKAIISSEITAKRLYQDNSSITNNPIELKEVTKEGFLTYLNNKLEIKPWINDIEISRTYGSNESVKTILSELKIIYSTISKKNFILDEGQDFIDEKISSTLTEYLKTNESTFNEIVVHYKQITNGTYDELSIKKQVRKALFNLFNQSMIKINKEKRIIMV